MPRNSSSRLRLLSLDVDGPQITAGISYEVWNKGSGWHPLGPNLLLPIPMALLDCLEGFAEALNDEASRRLRREQAVKALLDQADQLTIW